jgi:uncharacterized protein YjbI with pentapeptide repeats
MAQPPPALVRPQVISQVTGERLLLEDALENILERAATGAVCIFGPPGSGKSTALRSLGPKIPRNVLVELLDEPERHQVVDVAERMVAVYTARTPLDIPHLATFFLDPWEEDEAVEYLLAAHRERCGSVVARLRASGGRDLLNLPRLWTLCLDLMAEDESILDVDSALKRHLDRQVPPHVRVRARLACFDQVVGPEVKSDASESSWGDPGYMAFLRNGLLPPDHLWLVREPRFRLILAAEKLVDPMNGDVWEDGLFRKLPDPLIELAGRLLQAHPEAGSRFDARLRRFVKETGSHRIQPMGASLLHAARFGWRPDQGAICWLPGARFRGASWPGLNLPQAQLNEADLSGATLRESTLDGASVAGARLQRANLSDASLVHLGAQGADLSGADLRRANAHHASFINASLKGADLEAADLREATFLGADLSKARFRRADLKRATFQRVFKNDLWTHPYRPLEEVLEQAFRERVLVKDHPGQDALFTGTDFTGADLEGAGLALADLGSAILSGAILSGADLRGARLEGTEIPGARFERAQLNFAALTGSAMPGASFRAANLFGARLAEIEWERADLRDADLRRMTFHLGSSRSGLVFGEPSEGTRRGFYTDDYHDQAYRAPEEIRVANLRRADLRGARVDDTDFYLVDLREANYSAEQGIYFRRCGAILEARV